MNLKELNQKLETLENERRKKDKDFRKEIEMISEKIKKEEQEIVKNVFARLEKENLSLNWITFKIGSSNYYDEKDKIIFRSTLRWENKKILSVGTFNEEEYFNYCLKELKAEEAKIENCATSLGVKTKSKEQLLEQIAKLERKLKRM